ncbi:MAG TPA: DNA ligase D [Longimicrobiales bacterium]|nr:DNA ligase D [Longimicrobiales bacterium]
MPKRSPAREAAPVPQHDRLAAYREKRSASRTPEPFGGRVVAGGSIFVVQKHAARNLHWDLRLELDGVLLSWAVPKGPSPNQADKRLAMQTEDHPLEYAEFEGVIPEGEYGAGAMIVWDKGVWVPLEDAHRGLETGKLLFELRGHKLHGSWTLVKTRQAERSWLLIKERDAYMDEGRSTEDYPDDSIFSGLTVEEFPQADAHAEETAARVAETGAKRRAVRAKDVGLMLATSEERPFTREGWIFELKYDGYRLLAERHGREPYLRSRAGHALTATFPEIARAVRGLPYEGLVLDGEVVVNDLEGRPSFSRLQKRGRILNRDDALRASVELPATYHAFDILALEGFDVRTLPLLERKEILKEVLPTVGPIRYADHIEEQGEAMYEQVERMRLEGIVGKKADAPYRGGRSRSWIKVRTVRIEKFVVVGWTEPKGSRGGFGSLHLGQYDGEELVYRGAVGSGFKDSELDAVLQVLEEIEVPSSPCEQGPVPRGRGHHWVRPQLVAEVKYKELTDAGVVRQASFGELKPDARPETCVVEGSADGAPPDPTGDPGPVEAPEERAIPFTNLDKVFWPEEGYTKGDLIEYHRRVAEWMLPYLEDRPLVMTRYPDGIDGKSFFQKDAPPYAPEWFRRVTLWSEGSERELSYFVAEDLESLLYVINLGTIPLHIWSSRVDTLSQPDWCILDLDPKDAPFTDVVEIANKLHQVCEEIGLPSFVKTSGSSGIHVLVPLGRQLTYEQSRTLGQLLGRVVVSELPQIATLTRNPDRREGKVYVDFVQNGHGRLLAAPFTVRPRPGATVSAPVEWSEVNRRLTIESHTIESVPKRMKRLGKDPLRPVLDLEPDLLGVLESLTRWFD